MSTATYEDCVRVEVSSWPALASWLELQSDCGQFAMLPQGRGILADLQRLVGDGLYIRHGEPVRVEFKVEQVWTGNLFLETWSNRSRFKLGWLYTCNSDLLVFYFRDAAELYVTRTHDLKAWVFGQGEDIGHRCELKEVKQRKTEQRNDTWGLLAPCFRLFQDIKIHRWALKEGTWRREAMT
jgi:hypothetical protein